MVCDHLMINQGKILDKIDYNMEDLVEHTQTGIVQLEKAAKIQKSARPMQCIIHIPFDYDHCSFVDFASEEACLVR